jgi:putative membrane protein insertion efficiency factor
MKYLFIAVIRFYRKFISPLKAPCCRFKPTCSEYALEAFKERGVFVGFYLTVHRLLRCQPFYKGDVYDPVPPKRVRQKNSKDSKFLQNKAKGKLRNE